MTRAPLFGAPSRAARRPHDRPARRAAPLVVTALGLSAIAADCQQCQQVAAPNRGNVDRVADVVLVEGADGHAWAITANPELEHLRVLDLTAGAFVTGPNRFFPLSVPMGRETRALAVAVQVDADGATHADTGAVYALDGADDVVQVVALPGQDDGTAAFTVVDLLPTGRAPDDLAALRVGDTTTIAVTVPGVGDDGAVLQLLARGGADDGTDQAVALPDGSQPTAVVADPLGRAFVVADAALPFVHIVERGDDGGWALVRSLDVDGPCSELAAGVVDVGDGLAPVVLALRSDTPAAVAVRLFRPGFREDRYAVLGGAALPSLGVTALVADARPGVGEGAAPVTVCCRGLDDDRVAAGEATAAFAAVHQANGQLVYLQVAAGHIDDLALAPGRRVVRLVDDDGAPTAPPEGVDVNADASLWVPATGGEDRRPVVAFASVDDFGSPPFVPLIDDGLVLSLKWEGDVPGLVGLRGDFAAGPRTFTARVDVGARDGRVGDVARLTPAAPLAGCAADHRARVLGIDGSVVTVAVDGDGSGATPALPASVVTGCLQGVGDVRLTIEAQGAFVVKDALGYVDRLRPVEGDAAPSVDDETALALPGVHLSVTTPAGLPAPGSALLVPLDAHVQTMGLALSASTAAGGLGSAGLVPTGLAAGAITIPDAASDDDGAVIEARRMVITTSSPDGSGLPLVLTADEAETSTLRVETFR